MVGVVDVSCVGDGFDGHQTWIGTKVSGSNFRSQSNLRRVPDGWGRLEGSSNGIS